MADIVTYVAKRNVQAARTLARTIESAVLPLARRPLLFRPGRVDGTRELVAHPNYIVVYCVFADRVEIVSVLHARQQYP